MFPSLNFELEQIFSPANILQQCVSQHPWLMCDSQRKYGFQYLFEKKVTLSTVSTCFCAVVVTDEGACVSE